MVSARCEGRPGGDRGKRLNVKRRTSTSQDTARPEASKIARPYRDPEFLIMIRPCCPTKQSEQVARVSVARCSVVGAVGSSSGKPGRGGTPRASLCTASEPGRRTRHERYLPADCQSLSPANSMVYICDLTPVEVLGWAATVPHRHQPFPRLSTCIPCITITAYLKALPSHP